MRTSPATLVITLLALALAFVPAPPGAFGGEGAAIGVSGHWVIEVRDPDGTLAARREFHNLLLGKNPISKIVTSQRSPGALDVRLLCSTAACTSPCPGGAQQGPFCRIIEPRETVLAASASLFKNLTAELVAGGFRLRGFAVAARDGAFERVATSMITCVPTVAPSACTLVASSDTLDLTQTDLPAALSVVGGQQVQVTVTITFATATPAPAAAQSLPR
jgi:hypothetical protein